MCKSKKQGKKTSPEVVVALLFQLSIMLLFAPGDGGTWQCIFICLAIPINLFILSVVKYQIYSVKLAAIVLFILAPLLYWITVLLRAYLTTSFGI